MNRSRGFKHQTKRGFKRNTRPYINKHTNDKEHEQLSEKEVGITEYISDLKGFSGVLKARFSDFHVNEISLNGEIAKFTNMEIPEGLGPAPEREIPEETPSEHIPQEIWDQIGMILDNSEKVVELDVTEADKTKRGAIHNTVKGYYERKITASTIEREGKKFIQFKKFNKADNSDQRVPWTVAEFVHFLVYKENVDTLEAVMKISDCLRMKSGSFTYAGVKDRRAKTTQWVSVRKVDPSKLLKKTRVLRNIHIGNICFKDDPIQLGDLIGNRFRIALRNVSAKDDEIDIAMKSLAETGFINYYGLQRFGNSKEVPTHNIGLQLLLGNFKSACELILKPRKTDNPDSDVAKAKKIYFDSKNAQQASEVFSENENICVEHKLLLGMSKVNTNDYVTALESVPRNMRLLYIHSFQGLVWNKMVSKRIKEFGLKPIVGDLVWDDVKEEINEHVDEKKDEKNKEDCETIEVSKKKRPVKILSEADLENYDIYKILLPLPGYEIIYPENKMKAYYQEELENCGLSLEMLKQSVKTYNLSGSYRKILNRVKDLSWKITRYDDPNETLILSDFEEFLGKSELEVKSQGLYKALIIDFCLKSSCYATMVIREILKTDTSTKAHTKLNNYHKEDYVKKKEINNTKTNDSNIVPIDGLAPDSLLSDAAKYEEFKKSIFGDTDDLKRKSEEEESQEVPNKKSKTIEG